MMAVDLRARLRLLQSLTSRGSSEIAALLIPPAILWLATRSAPALVTPLLVWWGLMAVMATGLMGLRLRLRRQWRALEGREADAHLLRRWERQLALAGLINGLMWATAIWFTWPPSHVDLRLFVYLVLVGVLASGTTFLAPVPLVFGGFFMSIYVPMLAVAAWYFPSKGNYLLPLLLLLFGMTIARHAWGARQFVRQQLAHERERQALADSYRIAKIEAENALAEKNWFLSAASHDLRQPLHALGLMLEATRQRNHDAEVAGLLDDVQDCARDLGGMFNDLLDLSRLESRSFVQHPQAVALAQVFEEARRMFAHDAAQRGLTLSIFTPRRHAVVLHTDQALLRQMVFNLVQNALRYTARGGVLLGCRRRQGRWQLQVWDTGAGIAAEEQTRIFSRHYRTSSGQDRESHHGLPPSLRGHGLGLSVVALAAGHLGVDYGVQSCLERGSCFWLHWPQQPEMPAVIAASSLDGRPGAGKLPRLQGRCLVLDNEALVGQAMERILQAWGVEVRWLRSGRQVWTVLASGWLPDFVLCDQQLDGGEQGFDVLQQVLDDLPHASGALMSGDMTALEQAQEQGYLVLPKPLQPQELHAILARCFAQRSNA